MSLDDLVPPQGALYRQLELRRRAGRRGGKISAQRQIAAFTSAQNHYSLLTRGIGAGPGAGLRDTESACCRTSPLESAC